MRKAKAHRLDSEVPWPDIRYIFGEIMYGGHITDQWDRRVCNTYLLTLVLPELLSNMNLAPGFKSPDASKLEYTAYQKQLGRCGRAGAGRIGRTYSGADWNWSCR